MTRDECLKSVGAAFGEVNVEATSGLWCLRVKTDPECEVVLMPSFVNAHIDVDGMTPNELTERIKDAPEGHWSRVGGAIRSLVLSHR